MLRSTTTVLAASFVVIGIAMSQAQAGRLDDDHRFCHGAAHAGHCIGSVSSWYIT